MIVGRNYIPEFSKSGYLVLNSLSTCTIENGVTHIFFRYMWNMIQFRNLWTFLQWQASEFSNAKSWLKGIAS